MRKSRPGRAPPDQAEAAAAGSFLRGAYPCTARSNTSAAGARRRLIRRRARWARIPACASGEAAACGSTGTRPAGAPGSLRHAVPVGAARAVVVFRMATLERAVPPGFQAQQRRASAARSSPGRRSVDHVVARGVRVRCGIRPWASVNREKTQVRFPGRTVRSRRDRRAGTEEEDRRRAVAPRRLQQEFGWRRSRPSSTSTISKVRPSSSRRPSACVGRQAGFLVVDLTAQTRSSIGSASTPSGVWSGGGDAPDSRRRACRGTAPLPARRPEFRPLGVGQVRPVGAVVDWRQRSGWPSRAGSRSVAPSRCASASMRRPNRCQAGAPARAASGAAGSLCGGAQAGTALRWSPGAGAELTSRACDGEARVGLNWARSPPPGPVPSRSQAS